VKRLTLMRHANAQWKDPQISDFDRPLNRRGNSEAEAMSRRLIELKLIPTILLTSSARRARQTADIVARELGVAARNMRSEESLYLAPAVDILRLIQTTGPRIPHLMIVGHNPGITEVANLLAPSHHLENLATAAVFLLTFDTRTWSGVEASNLRDLQSESPPTRLFALWA
jgi:phosphohistidine phosphatase